MAKKAKTRKRGGASYECPTCGSPSRVVDTRREDDGVRRQRQCLKRTKHQFTTVERLYRAPQRAAIAPT